MTTSAGRPATTTPLDFVPELLDDFVRRDIDGETVVWAASAPQPVVLHPVTTVMLDVIDGRASIRELALDVHEEIGIPLETAQRQVIGVVEQLTHAQLLTSSRGNSTSEAAIQSFEIFVSAATPCAENASRLGTESMNLRLAGEVYRVACDSKRGARMLRTALRDHLADDVDDAPLAFTLTAPQGFKRNHELTDRAGLVLSAGLGLDAGIHALACNLTAFLPPERGTVRIRARALVAGDRTIVCLPPLLYFPPLRERDLRRAGVGIVDRMALDIDIATGRIVNPQIPWPALAKLRRAPSHLGTGGTRDVDMVIDASLSPAQTPAQAVAQLASNAAYGAPADILDAAARMVEHADVRTSGFDTKALLLAAASDRTAGSST